MAVDAIVADTAAAPSQVRTSSRKRRHIQDDEYQHYQHIDSLAFSD